MLHQLCILQQPLERHMHTVPPVMTRVGGIIDRLLPSRSIIIRCTGCHEVLQREDGHHRGAFEVLGDDVTHQVGGEVGGGLLLTLEHPREKWLSVWWVGGGVVGGWVCHGWCVQ